MARCTLHVGKHLALVALGGAPEIEYGLFDPGEIELQATEPSTIREVGYRTTAGEARGRLNDMAFTAALADEATEAARTSVVRGYARGSTVRSIVQHLGSAELWEGGTYDAAVRRYAGAWLELAFLATDIGMADAPALMQGLHLAAWLAEVPDDEPVVLATAELSRERRPGERTYRRPTLESPAKLVEALRTLRPVSGRGLSDEASGFRDVVTRVRECAHRSSAASNRMRAVEVALGRRERPARGPLADAELWAIETGLAEGEPSRAIEQLEALERRRGRLPATTYLRERAALLSRREEPAVVAERVSALSTSMSAFHELELLAAQAWAAAGDSRRARAFARDLVEDGTAPDAIRVLALAVLEEAERSGEPSSGMRAALPVAPPPSSASRPSLSMPLSSSPGPSSSMTAAAPSASPTEAKGPDWIDLTAIPPPAPAATPPASRSPGSRSSPIRSSVRAPPAGASLPPYRAEAVSTPPPEAPVPAAAVERVETLSSPPGTPEDLRTLSTDPPRTPLAARVAFTAMARELARDLRMRHGLELQTDVQGLEHSQRYLREALVDGRVRTAEERREVMRHGAFLSELLARRLGANWIDVDVADPGRWAMLVPRESKAAEGLRIWPFGRVLRFVVMGHKERDLVSYYLELEARSR